MLQRDLGKQMVDALRKIWQGWISDTKKQIQEMKKGSTVSGDRRIKGR